jgi:maleylacetate reductase
MTMRFEHEAWPQRVRFEPGAGPQALADEVSRLGVSRAMVIAADSERELAAQVAADVPVAGWHHEVAMHVPVAVAERARRAAAENDVDVLIPVGGGSTTGLAKAVALTTGLPVIAVPTTYAGSEATAVWGLTDHGRKTTGTDRRVLPRTIVYDAALMLSLPVDLSVASGLNAVAHCVDSMWAPKSDPIDRALAGEGIRALRTGLPMVTTDPTGLEGREHALYGAYLAAVAFASAGSGLHHKICHVLGGMFDLPHAQTHAVVLPHVLALNAPHAPEAEQRIAAALDTDDALTGLVDLYALLGAPRALRDLGMPRDGITRATDAVLAAVPADNPVVVTREGLTALLNAAWEGEDPR